MDLSGTLLAAQSSDLPTRTAAEAQLSAWEAQSLPQFGVALAAELSAEEKDPNSRQLAGLQLKNLLAARDAALADQKAKRWIEMIDPDSKSQMKKMCVTMLRSPVQQAAHTAAQVVARIGSIELPHQHWPDLLTVLLQNMTTTEDVGDVCKIVTLEALGYMCEDLDEDSLDQNSTNQILTAIVDGIREDRPDLVRVAAANALVNSLIFTRNNFDNERERNMIMQVICGATKSTCVQVRVVAYECISRIASLFYDKLGLYMQSLFELTLSSIRADEEQVGMMAIEFWSSICEEEMEILDEVAEEQQNGVAARNCARYIQAALPHLVPVLLMSTLMKQDEAADEDTWNMAAAGAICLGLVANTVEDQIVPTILEFVQGNIMHAEWRHREAAIMAFGQIMDGPKSETLAGPVATAMPVLINALSDQHMLVKDTAAWTLARICELHAIAIPQQLLHPLVDSLTRALGDSSRVAAQACFAVHNLAQAFEQSDQTAATNALSPFFSVLLQKLLHTTEREDCADHNLRGQAYEAVNMLIQNHAEDVKPVIIQVMPLILERLARTFAINVLTNDDRDERDQLQSLLCALLQVITRALAEDIGPFSDDIIRHILQIFQNNVQGVAGEEAFMTVGAIASQLDKGFEKYMAAFHPYLIQGLRNYQEWQVCQAAVGTTGDICRALEVQIYPYCDAIVLCLLDNLRNPDLNRQVKPNVLAVFGDIALAIGANFEKYLANTLMMLSQASQTQIPEDDEELVEYLNLLRESILEAYTGVIQGLNDGGKAFLMIPQLEGIFDFLQAVYRDSMRSLCDADVVKASIGLVGDLVSTLGREAHPFVQRDFIQGLLKQGIEDESMQQITQWTQGKIQELRMG